MLHEPKTIRVPEGSELARALDAAETTPVRLEKDGVVFRVEREGTRALDHATALAAIDAAAGSWADLDVDAVIAYIYRAREEGSRPANRP